MYTELDPRQSLQPHLPRILNREIFYRGQTIIEQGCNGYHAYFIEKGRVEILMRDGHHTVRINELGPGEIFGEMALIEQQERSAMVRAVIDTTVTVISAPDLERKISQIEDKAVQALMHVFLHRLRQANEGQLRQYRNLAAFQDRITGLIEKAGRGIDESKRSAFRDEAEPLLQKLEGLLEQYRS